MTAPPVPERMRSLIVKSRICAMVVGRGAEHKFFYLSEFNVEADLIAAVKSGFINAGLLGFHRGVVLMEPDVPGGECERILQLAVPDFLLAVSQMKPGAPSN